ncbi:hypothetical protein AB0G60_15270 [Streptomyces angustmyceticus]|uniref:Uncharacterized protein n=1 Tax=Streptomyces angustmyceticus TaxID=285578 RepID=A0A5J4LNS8_9ACTN|nr:hypothetical protein [Streptomyces angustmyceticus]UAL66982.1 hypothetical protein K7396_10920 [Streptomyces angustmyceticus]GES32118.1 hypothetical protein San01_46050 [Streptomyces angustmyceticus]
MTTHRTDPAGPSDGLLRHPRAQRALRGAKLLVGCYAGLSALTLCAVYVLRHHPDLVTGAVWIRVVIVVATSLLMTSFAARTARGHRRSYLRLRLASAVMAAAIAVIVALPGGFPTWLKLEQGVCGALLLGVVMIVNGRRLRAAFASR